MSYIFHGKPFQITFVYALQAMTKEAASMSKLISIKAMSYELNALHGLYSTAIGPSLVRALLVLNTIKIVRAGGSLR